MGRCPKPPHFYFIAIVLGLCPKPHRGGCLSNPLRIPKDSGVPPAPQDRNSARPQECAADCASDSRSYEVGGTIQLEWAAFPFAPPIPQWVPSAKGKTAHTQDEGKKIHLITTSIPAW